MARKQDNGSRGRKPRDSAKKGKPDYRRNKSSSKSNNSRDSTYSDYSRGKSRKDNGSEKFKIECSGCGKNCEVPFKPTGNKPVLCNRCYKISEGKSTNESAHRAPKTRSGTPLSMLPGRRGKDRISGERTSSRGTEAELKEINRKLDKIMKAMGLN